MLYSDKVKPNNAISEKIMAVKNNTNNLGKDMIKLRKLARTKLISGELDASELYFWQYYMSEFFYNQSNTLQIDWFCIII